MNYGPELMKYNISFLIDSTQFHIVSANHGVFITSFPRHSHTYYELHYIIGGKGTLILDDCSYPLEKGDVYIIPPKLCHEQLTSDKDPMEECHFSFEMHSTDLPQSEIFQCFLEGVGFWYGKDKQHMEVLFTRIENEITDQRIGFQYNLCSLYQMLLISYVRNLHKAKYPNTPPLMQTKDDRRSNIADEAMLYRYKDITLPQLAALMNLSIVHTRRFLLKNFGMNFGELRTLYRMNIAASLLKTTNDPVYQIAEETGYANPIYFSEKFHKQFGMNPNEYRKQHVEQEQSNK